MEPDLSLLQEFLDAGRLPGEEPVKEPEPERTSRYLDIEIAQHTLSALLRKASHSIPSTDWRPVLKNFLLMATEDKLRIVSSTGDFSTVLETSQLTVRSPGYTLLPARDFLETIKVAGSGVLRVQIESDKVKVSQDRVEWELPLYRQSPYPPLPTLDTVHSVDREKLLVAINAVRYAICTDITRPSLGMIQVKNGKATASDGERFQQTDLDCPIDMNIPRDVLPDIIRILDSSAQQEIELGLSTDHIALVDGQDTFWFNKSTARFGDAENFLLKPALYNNRPLTVAKEPLLTAIRHVRLNADPKTSAIGLFLTRNQIAVSARNQEGAKATEFIDASWGGRERVLVVNHTFLNDLLRMHSQESCTFLLGDDSKSKRHPLLLRDEERGTVGLIQQMHGGRAVYDRL